MLSLPQYFAQNGMGDAKYGIAKILDANTKVASLLGVEQMNGLVHKYGQEADLGTVGTRSVNEPFPVTQPGYVTPVEEPIAIGGGVVNTDHRIEAITTGSRAVQISRKTRATARWMDAQILNGNRTKNPKDLNGLKNRCTGSQLLTAGTNGSPLTLGLFEQLIDSVEDVGHGRVVLCNKTIARQFKSRVLAEAGGATVADVVGETFTYEGVKVIPVLNDETGAPLLGFNEKMGTVQTTTSMYCIAPGSGDDKSGVVLLAASNSIELVEEGIRNAMYVDLIEVAFGITVYEKTSAARLAGLSGS